MLKLPKGLKKKKKGKKSKKKGEQELFTEEELEKYRREHQQQPEGDGAVQENEEWSKFKDLTTGVDSVLKKTQGDLDRIKSTSFFQRIPAGVKETKLKPKEEPSRPVVEVTEADFPQLAAAAAAAAAAAVDDERSSCAVTDDESDEEDEGDDIFDTSYVDAVERGEVKLGYVPDSPTDYQDDDLFDTSHVDALIKGQEAKTSKGKKSVDIGLAVGVLTGRIDNVTVTSTRRKRVVPGDLLLESTDGEGAPAPAPAAPVSEPVESSLLDTDADIPITTPIDLSVSLHTSLLQQSRRNSLEDLSARDRTLNQKSQKEEEEDDEFTLLAAESLETSSEVIKVEKEISLEPVLQESWSAFEADKSESVFAECIVEDQIDVVDPYIDQDDPFDTSFADAVVPVAQQQLEKEAVILEDDDDFDPRADEFQARLNNRRKSSVRIHLTDPSGVRESITSDEVIDKEKEEFSSSRDLLGGSTTDLTQLGDSPLDPVDINNTEIDPFDTTIVDKIVAPGKVELKLLERELIDSTPAPVPIFRVPSDPDFDPRAEEPTKLERRASRPENLVVSKSVVFNVDRDGALDVNLKTKPNKPVTPYYTREVSITEDFPEETESADTVPDTLTRTRSDEDLAPKQSYHTKRRHSEFPAGKRAPDLLRGTPADLPGKVLTPAAPKRPPAPQPPSDTDPFDTSFAGDIAPSRTELRLLAKEFSCEDSSNAFGLSGEPDLLEPPGDNIFQAKALTPEPSDAARVPQQEYDPFDTSFAGDLNPGRTELKLLESEFLN